MTYLARFGRAEQGPDQRAYVGRDQETKGSRDQGIKSRPMFNVWAMAATVDFGWFATRIVVVGATWGVHRTCTCGEPNGIKENDPQVAPA